MYNTLFVFVVVFLVALLLASKWSKLKKQDPNSGEMKTCWAKAVGLALVVALVVAGVAHYAMNSRSMVKESFRMHTPGMPSGNRFRFNNKFRFDSDPNQEVKAYDWTFTEKDLQNLKKEAAEQGIVV